MEGGPDMKFTSYNRPPRSHHPTYRMLLMETDSSGAHTNYLAEEARFQTLKRLHHANRIVPLVGDFGGLGAVRRTGDDLRRRGLQVNCLYISNVEFYLFRGERWQRYVANIRSLPWADRGCIIRSYANVWQPHPAQIPGYYMSTLLQPVRDVPGQRGRRAQPDILGNGHARLPGALAAARDAMMRVTFTSCIRNMECGASAPLPRFYSIGRQLRKVGVEPPHSKSAAWSRRSSKLRFEDPTTEREF